MLTTMQPRSGSAPVRLRAPLLRHVLVALLFVVLYLALDRISYIHPLQSFGITPWNPPPALSLVLLLVFGLGFAPALFVAALLAELLVHHNAPLPVQFASAAVLASGYAAAAWLLGRLRLQRALQRRRDLMLLLGVVSGAAFAVGAAYVGIYAAAGLIPGSAYLAALLRFWVGDVIGMLGLLPLLLVLADSARRKDLAEGLGKPLTWLQFAVLTAGLWVVFGLDFTDEFKYFYLLFMPLVWIAMRHGLALAALAIAITEAGVITAVSWGGHEAMEMIELQAMMLAFSVTGLFLGVTVDERQRAVGELRQSLRLAAAAEMAGALTHELNQPLSALVSYARATRLLLEQGKTEGDVLDRTLGKVVDEASRAAAIVRRLRDFLRRGSTRLAPCDPVALLREAAAGFAEAARQAQAEIRVDVPATLPEAWLDEVEISIVLRNLLANALDAVASCAPGQRLVLVRAFADQRLLRLTITDSGAGITQQMHSRLFEPFLTSKPNGMGMGLAISRAIVEAHGGELWAETGPPGVFHLTLPLGMDERHDEQR